MNAIVKNLDWADSPNREIKVIISAKGSKFIDEARDMHVPPMIINSAPLIAGINMVLKGDQYPLSALYRYNDLSARVRQLLSALEYDKLTDFQAKLVLLVERELQTIG